jgi:hypothetical protein
MTPDERSNGRSVRALWVAGTLLFGAAVVLVAARESDEGLAFALGAAIGAGLAALLVAAIARFAWTRLRGRGELLAPSLLLIAGLVCLAGLGVRAAQQGADTAAREDAADECAAASPEPFPAPTEGLSYRELTPAEEERLRTEAAIISDTGIADGRHVLFGDQSLANMAAIPGYQDQEERDELRDRLNEAASVASADVRSIDGLEAPGMLLVVRGKPRLITTSGCYAFLIGGEDERTVLYVARRLFSSGTAPVGSPS